jgi:osmotically-inducible protein OsmY
MDAKKVKRLPVVDELGRLVGVVTRGDLLKVHLRPDDDIRQDIETGVLRGPLAGLADGVAATVTDGVVTLTGHLEQWSVADAAVRLTRQVAGVADISDQLTFEIDDRAALGTGIGFAAG